MSYVGALGATSLFPNTRSRPVAVDVELRQALARAQAALPRARSLTERRNIQGKIRTLKLALEDLKRQRQVNPKWVPGNRPADGQSFALTPRGAPSVPFVPPQMERAPSTAISMADAITGPSAKSPSTVALTPQGAEPVVPAYAPEALPASAPSNGILSMVSDIPWWGWVIGGVVIWNWKKS